ncbi:ATP-binding protein [Rhodococcus sp. NPDC019627]|uniref:ATP-binding protein n=1 Tax=unclassified Rhodococcus (in: high G+C Gram-positive bacteria) TaxID=192944 RepID=UPI00340A9A81
MADLATAVTVLDANGRAGVPSLLISGPGMGKSSLVRGLAASDGVLCETVLGSLREPADFAGLPVVREHGVTLEAPDWAKRIHAEGGGYLFLDELTTSPPAVQAAMLAVALDLKVGDLQLPKGTRVIAGANPPDCAAGGYELEAPLANRFCHVEFTPSVDEWLDGMATGWATPPASRAVATDEQRVALVRSSITGYVQRNPEALDAFPSSAAQTGGAWPSRRTWAMLAAVLPHLRDDDNAAINAAVFGLIGEGTGVEFLEWRRNADLPDPVAVIENPETAFDWQSRPDLVWAVLSGVTAWAAGRGTVEAWRSAWGPLIAAAEAGAPDVAGAAARTLAKARPAKAVVPAAARRFSPVLVAAGLVGEAA